MLLSHNGAQLCTVTLISVSLSYVSLPYHAFAALGNVVQCWHSMKLFKESVLDDTALCITVLCSLCSVHGYARAHTSTYMYIYIYICTSSNILIFPSLALPAPISAKEFGFSLALSSTLLGLLPPEYPCGGLAHLCT